MNELSKRILKISYEKGLSHLGSCLTAVNIIDDIYKKIKPGEKFVLSSGHAGLALYVVLEKYYKINAEYLFDKHGVHPNRDLKDKIYCSSGSLGHGLPIALGMALANRKKNVYCLISDGEAMEGSIWEALRIKVENKVDNLKVHINCNGWRAYDKVDTDLLVKRLKAFDHKIIVHGTELPVWEFVKDPQEMHYKSLSSAEYLSLINKPKPLSFKNLSELFKQVNNRLEELIEF